MRQEHAAKAAIWSNICAASLSAQVEEGQAAMNTLFILGSSRGDGHTGRLALDVARHV